MPSQYVNRFQSSFFSKITKRVLVLGFYDRGNLGDELYKIIFPLILKKEYSVEFKCMDDMQVIPSDVDIIICGGGDIINKYFMEKLKLILGNGSYCGPLYAVSVGIPFDEDRKYLNMFDHVIVRSQYDYTLACNEIGTHNVTFTPDIGFFAKTIVDKTYSPRSFSTRHINIGVCIATPVLLAYKGLHSQLLQLFKSVLGMNKDIHLHLFPFNTFTFNQSECDIGSSNMFVHDIVEDYPQANGRCHVHIIHDAITVIQRMKEMSFNICMRFHSVVFSLINNTPFITVFANKKVAKVLDDMDNVNNHIDLHQVSIQDVKDLAYNKIKQYLPIRPKAYSELSVLPQVVQACSVLSNNVKNKTLRHLRIRHVEKSMENTVKNLAKFLDMYFYTGYFSTDLLKRTGALDVHGKEPTAVARAICYSITGSIDNACVWGLSQNILKFDFNLKEAVEYIYKDFNNRHDRDVIAENYYPPILERRCFISIDPYINNDFSGVHRSGWAFVVSNLMNLDSYQFDRKPKLIVDTYLDRTFHWGLDTLVSAHCIPYINPWIGFIHHTFDTTHSDYNCQTMFANEYFLASLDVCKGLIVLSEYLAVQIRQALITVNKPNIPVFVIYHPTEFVDVNSMFTFERFLNNPRKKIIQIGAWLRNPYSIYELPLYIDEHNPLNIHKAVLKGSGMDGYFAPTDFFSKFEDTFFVENEASYSCISGNHICRPHHHSCNKYILGMYNMLTRHNTSVEILSKLSNAEYDDMLASNIVFLDLVDCSAVNTVIECAVRNTVIIVNRHPAVEEILGKQYPGFYNTLVEAVSFIGNSDNIKNAYNYMKALDKTRLKIETFMSKIQDVLANISI